MSRLSWLSVLVCSLCLTMVAAAPALAHAELESAVHAGGRRQGQMSTRDSLSFAEPVEAAFSPIEVYDQEGNRVDGDDARSDPDDGRVVLTSLREGNRCRA